MGSPSSSARCLLPACGGYLTLCQCLAFCQGLTAGVLNPWQGGGAFRDQSMENRARASSAPSTLSQAPPSHLG